MSEEKVSGGVQSLEIGIHVFNSLVEHNNPIMLKDLSHKLGMHPAKVHRYLASLIRMNYARQLEDGQYGLGEQAWRLGLRCIQHTDTLQLVQSQIYEMQGKIGSSIQISKWSPRGPLVVQSIESLHPVSIVTRVGSIMPLVNSAAGRIYASYLPEHLVRPLMEEEWKKHTSSNKTLSPKNWEEFLILKNQIQAQKMSVAQGDLLTGINAVGLPIFNTYNAIEFCIVVIDSEDMLPIQANHEKIIFLKQMAESINQYIRER